MIDWERLRGMMRQDLMRIVSQEKLSDKDYCDLKLILSNMERSYTNEMFEDGQNRYSEGSNISGYRKGTGFSNRYYGMHTNPEYYENDMSMKMVNNPTGRNQYSGHTQEEIFKSQLHMMANTAEDAATRRVIQEAMDKLR